MNFLQVLSEELTRALDSGLADDNLIKVSPTVIEWETDMGRFRFDASNQTMYVTPRVMVEHMDIKVTILPTGVSFDDI